MKITAILIIAFIYVNLNTALTNQEITFGTDWRAQAEHGGFYQALALGFYEDVGIDLIIRQGGPQVNHSQLLASGRIDFGMSPNSFIPLNFVAQKIPVKSIGAFFQKDPAVLISHTTEGHNTLADLGTAKIMISPDTRIGFWRFLRVKYGFQDSQISPYTFNLAPFLSNVKAVQQGYITSEPFLIRKAGKDPKIFLLADSGYASYAGLIQTSEKMIENSHEIVQGFINASILGWYSFLYNDPSPAYELIMKENPDMTRELLFYARSMIKEFGLVDGGDASRFGIGVMTNERWDEFFGVMSKDNLYPYDLKYRNAYSLKFTGNKFGMDFLKKNSGK